MLECWADPVVHLILLKSSMLNPDNLFKASLAGLESTASLHTNSIIFSCLVKSVLVKQETSYTVSISVLSLSSLMGIAVFDPHFDPIYNPGLMLQFKKKYFGPLQYYSCEFTGASHPLCQFIKSQLCSYLRLKRDDDVLLFFQIKDEVAKGRKIAGFICEPLFVRLQMFILIVYFFF